MKRIVFALVLLATLFNAMPALASSPTITDWKYAYRIEQTSPAVSTHPRGMPDWAKPPYYLPPPVRAKYPVLKTCPEVCIQ
jgi:hypothetical protein